MPVDARSRRLIRHGLGVSVAMTYAVACAWPMSFLAPVLAQKLLGKEGPPLGIKAGLGFIAVVAFSCAVALFIAMPLVDYPVVFVGFSVLALFRLTFAKAGGTSPIVVTFLVMTLLMIPLFGLQSSAFALIVAGYLVGGVAVAVFVTWIAEALLPDPPAAAVEAPVAPAPVAPVDRDRQARAAFTSALIVLPVLVLFYSFEWISHLLVLIFVSILSQEVDLAKGKMAGAMLVLGNTLGGLLAIMAYELLVLAPELPLLFLGIFAVSMLFGGVIFSEHRLAPLYNMAFGTLILILGSVVTSGEPDAGSKVWLRVMQIIVAGVYVVGAFTVVDLLGKIRPRPARPGARPVLAAMLVLALGGGCMVGPDYLRPPVPETPHYRGAEATPGSIANLPWWELYDDPVLEDLVRSALAGNRNLQATVAAIAEARANLSISRASLFPAASFGLGADASRAVQGGAYGNTAELGGALNVAYEVDLWGRVARAVDAAEQGFAASQEALQAVTLVLVADVANAYLQLRDLDERFAIAERTVRTRQDSVEIMRARFEGGAISQVDYEQAIVQLEDALTSVETFKRLRDQTEHALSVLLGEVPGAIARGRSLVAMGDPPSVPLGLPSELLERRPDLRQAERELAAQTARIGVAEADLFPSLTLDVGVSGQLANLGPDAGLGSLAADLAGPLLDAGRRRAQVEVEVARTDQLARRYQQAILVAFREVEDALTAVDTYRAQHASRQRQAEAARRAADLAQVRYEGGWTGYLEVLDIERSLFSAELQASEALRLYHSSVVDLYKALGGGW